MKMSITCLVCLALLFAGCGGGGSSDDDDDSGDNNNDQDGDGIEDSVDPFPDTNAGTTDSDGDGVADSLDPDADLDGDGISNGDDSDADGDGTADVQELSDLLSGTYDIQTTVTETNCVGETVGAMESDVITLSLSPDGEALNASLESLGEIIPLTGWRLGNDFYLTASTAEAGSGSGMPAQTEAPPEEEMPPEDHGGDLPEGCSLTTTFSISGGVEGAILTATETTATALEPAGCVPQFSDCQTVSAVEGTRRE